MAPAGSASRGHSQGVPGLAAADLTSAGAPEACVSKQAGPAGTTGGPRGFSGQQVRIAHAIAASWKRAGGRVRCLGA
jgi:hypothetical protein